MKIDLAIVPDSEFNGKVFERIRLRRARAGGIRAEQRCVSDEHRGHRGATSSGHVSPGRRRYGNGSPWALNMRAIPERPT
jgi:ribosomal protein L15E